MSTNWYKGKIEELGAIKTCINEIEAKYAPERADLNAKKSTMQKAYNKELEPLSKDKKAVEEEVESWMLETLEKERIAEEETGRIIPSAVVPIPNFEWRENPKIGEVDLTKVPFEYLMLDEKKVKEKRKGDGSFEVPGVSWKKSLILTHKNLGGK